MVFESAARDPEYREAVQRQVEKLLRSTPYHSLQLPDGTVIPGLIGIDALEQRISSFPIPGLLTGRRVLDVGAASGWNSFAMAARGAEVMAVDCVEFEELTAFQRLTGTNVDYRILDVDELSPATVGVFDYVLFLGVLYHLRHPLLSLERICSLTREVAFVESFVSDPVEGPSDACSMEFYENDDLGGQIDNWWGPTAKCLTALCRSAGFVRVHLEYVSLRRAGVTCHRRWEPEPEAPAAHAPWLLSAVNNRTGDIYFHPLKDEYLCVYFRSSETALTRNEIRIEVDGYGVNALVLVPRKDGEWQANSRLPPGLAPGEHTVRIRTAASRFRNPFRIVMTDGVRFPDSSSDVPDGDTANGAVLQIRKIENSLEGSNVFHGLASERLLCRFDWADRDLDRHAVFASIDDRPIAIAFLTDLGDGGWEANIALPRDLSSGQHDLKLRTKGSAWSQSVAFVVRADQHIGSL